MVDEARLRKAQDYLTGQTRLGLTELAVFTAAGTGFLLAGGFGWVDRIAGGFSEGPVVRALLYFLGLALLGQALDLPFAWYRTFVLEQRFGFNRTSGSTFLGDLLKGWGLGLALGGGLAAAVTWFFLHGGPWAWLWSWGFFTAFQLLVTFLAPAVLLPLFNRFEPLPGGELKDAIEAFARKVSFRVQGIFTMDGSRRSSKANAFFTGLGRFRRIVLFDTLLGQHTTPELVAVLAHEVGHFKKKHIPRQMLLALAVSFLMFWLFSLLLAGGSLTGDFGFERASFQATVTIAAWLYAPVSLFSGLASRALSRKFEYEADRFAAEATGEPGSLASALKKLSVESLSNLNPHPWKVALDYSHPPVAQRIRVLLSGK